VRRRARGAFPSLAAPDPERSGSIRIVLAAVLAIAISGCSEELGPERMPVTSVAGTITESGRPLSRGWVEFFPVEGTIGNLRSARIERDGSFQTDGVAIGRNLVRLVNADIKTPGLSRIFSSFQSPIRRAIGPKPERSLSIDLVTEAIQISTKRSRPERTPTRAGDSP
jgi:hypothetical protein